MGGSGGAAIATAASLTLAAFPAGTALVVNRLGGSAAGATAAVGWRPAITGATLVGLGLVVVRHMTVFGAAAARLQWKLASPAHCYPAQR